MIAIGALLLSLVLVWGLYGLFGRLFIDTMYTTEPVGVAKLIMSGRATTPLAVYHREAERILGVVSISVGALILALLLFLLDESLPSLAKGHAQLRRAVAGPLLLLGMLIFVFAFSIVLLNSVLFLAGRAMPSSTYWLSLLISITVCLGARRSLQRGPQAVNPIYPVLAFLLVLLASTVIASNFYDVSEDGQIYHQDAVDRLSQHWNPIWEKAGDVWIDHYAKSPWICAASVSILTSKVESGKAFNLTFIVGSFALSTALLLSIARVGFFYAVITGFIAAFNPVSISQSLSFYVDGQVASLLVALGSILGLFLIERCRTVAVLLLLGVVVLLSTAKFTGLVYSMIIIFLFGTYLFLWAARQDLWRFTLTSVLALILSVFIVGYNPYVTNSVTHGHPFFPLAGRGAIDIIGATEPIPLHGKPNFYRLLVSIFAQPGQYLSGSSAVKLQIPFWLETDSIESFQSPDTRLGGLGPFFSVMFVLATILCSILMVTKAPQRKMLGAALTMLWLTVLPNPVAWWARYVPQLWLFPLVPAVFILAYSRSKVLAKLAKGILVFGLIDIIIIGVTYTVSNFRTTREIRNFIASQRESGERLVIEDSGWRGPVIRLREHNVDYRVVDAHRLPCLQPERIPHSDVAYCREAMAGSRPR